MSYHGYFVWGASCFNAIVWGLVRWVSNRVVIRYDPNHMKIGEYSWWNLSTLVRIIKGIYLMWMMKSQLKESLANTDSWELIRVINSTIGVVDSTFVHIVSVIRSLTFHYTSRPYQGIMIERSNSTRTHREKVHLKCHLHFIMIWWPWHLTRR